MSRLKKLQDSINQSLDAMQENISRRIERLEDKTYGMVKCTECGVFVDYKHATDTGKRVIETRSRGWLFSYREEKIVDEYLCTRCAPPKKTTTKKKRGRPKKKK